MNDAGKRVEDEEMEEGEASDSEEEVEVNVTLSTDRDALLNNGVPYGPEPFPKLDSSSSFYEEDRKPVKRIEDDSIKSQPLPSDQAVKHLYKSLLLDYKDFVDGWWINNALHLWSAEKLDNASVKHYFRNYPSASIEWTSSNECNITWLDRTSSIRALLGLSCPIQYTEPAAPHLPPSPPRPPTRRHNITKDGLDDASQTDALQSKKKLKKNKAKKSATSGSSNSSSSSSDSDSSSSSSDSSSSDSDSSDSDSDTSSDSDSSSSTDSDSSDSDKVKAKKMKKTAKAAKKKTEEMEVDDSSHRDLASSAKEDPDLSDETVGVRVSDIPVSGPLPKGRWRLGVPCPTTTAILLRFANKDDLEKAQQMRWRMQDSGQDMKSTVRESHDSREPHKKSRRGVPSAVEAERGFAASPEERRIRRVKRSHHAGVKARLSGPKLGLPVMHPPGTAMPLYLPPRPEAYLPPLPPGVERTYRDLDDPVVEAVDNKDPWGSLAQNWGKRETGPSLDYQALLKSHRHALQGTKRKRDPDDDSGYDGARHNPRNLGRSRHMPTAARRAGDHRYEDSGGDDRHRSDEDDDGSSQSDASDDVVAWNAKIKLPRMKMYADVEEKRRKFHPKRQMEVREDAQWDPPKRDEGLPRKPKGSIFSRLGGGDGLGRHVPPENFREREFVARGDWAGEAERPSKRYRAENHEPRGAGGMRSEVKTVRSIKARLGGGVRHY